MIIFEVGNDPIIPGIKYTDKKTGNPAVTSERQTVYIHCGMRYPVTTTVDIRTGESPYRPGFYAVAGQCFRAGQYGMEFDDRKLVLQPLEEARTDMNHHPATGELIDAKPSKAA